MAPFKDLTGMRFGRLTVMGRAGKIPNTKKWLLLCQCDCGKILTVRYGNVISGNTESCGCYKKQRIAEKNIERFEDATGKRFGKLVCLEFVGRSKVGAVKWLCRCDCGNESIHLLNNLKMGRATSCGCIQREIARENARILGHKGKGHSYSVRHGHARPGRHSPTYQSWHAMIGRTTNPNAANYKNYGGRGIKPCPEWLSFEVFLQEMGERLDGCSLGRIDNNLGYCKTNCRWEPAKVQQRNKRSNLIIEHNGQSKTLADWSEVSGIPYATLRERLHHKWSIDRALTQAIQSRRRRDERNQIAEVIA